ncbi:MAG: Urease accessory protein UreE [Alphaproteobacteria bacterium]|nr:Urease accessory protein UreE [Alphaproteobacteria bacterium]
MLGRATSVVAAGGWPEGEERGRVVLDYDDRHRRRIRLRTDDDRSVQLDLDDATRLADGDGLALDGGGYVRVVAAEEAVADLRCHDLVDTARIAWHVGNRHIPVQVLADGTLRIRDDHVIVAMAERLGAHVTRLNAPFSPEPGAYAGEHASHDHQHEDGHGHGHGH